MTTRAEFRQSIREQSIEWACTPIEREILYRNIYRIVRDGMSNVQNGHRLNDEALIIAFNSIDAFENIVLRCRFRKIDWTVEEKSSEPDFSEINKCGGGSL